MCSNQLRYYFQVSFINFESQLTFYPQTFQLQIYHLNKVILNQIIIIKTSNLFITHLT